MRKGKYVFVEDVRDAKFMKALAGRLTTKAFSSKTNIRSVDVTVSRDCEAESERLQLFVDVTVFGMPPHENTSVTIYAFDSEETAKDKEMFICDFLAGKKTFEGLKELS